jgi:membrane-associated phospholipid phosphatase
LASTRRRRRSPFGTVVRAGAVAALAAGFVVPLVRRRLRVPAPVTVASVVAAPVALAVLRPRTKGRDAVLFTLQMWAFVILHELPYDDPERLRRRLRVRYPIRADRVLGAGELPTARLQRALASADGPTALDRVLTIVHWAWFGEPHLARVWILVRHNDSFPRAARQLAAAYDLGCAAYALVPTAPPWWAAEQGYAATRVRRVMVEVGEPIWGRAWPVMYESLGGNPWAAMPSLHFATSVLAAILLAETGAVEGIAGWGYAATLGFALVYLGEHYVIDLVGAVALVAAIRYAEPRLAPVAGLLSGGVQRLERLAAG